MLVDELQEWCAQLPGAWPDNPFGHDHDLYKVGPQERGKIFAFVSDTRVGVKCGDRAAADEWLHRYPEDASVMAYIGRSGWNDLRIDGGIPADEIRSAVVDSYAFVLAGLPKRLRPVGWESAVERLLGA